MSPLVPHHLEALQLYKELHGHMMVPMRFQVPFPVDAAKPGASGDWPHHLHGLRLGQVVHDLRKKHKQRKLAVDTTRTLMRLGFVFDVFEHHWHHETLAALKWYKQNKGEFPIHKSFVVPSGDAARWPARFWGKQLGLTYRNLFVKDRKFTAQQLAELDELGVPTERNDSIRTRKASRLSSKRSRR